MRHEKFYKIIHDEILAPANLKLDSEKLDLLNQLLAAKKQKELSKGDANDLEQLGLQYDRINLSHRIRWLKALEEI